MKLETPTRKPKVRARKWPFRCKMCGKVYKSAISTGAKFCSNACGSMYWRRNKQFEAWKASLKTSSDEELIKEYESANT